MNAHTRHDRPGELTPESVRRLIGSNVSAPAGSPVSSMLAWLSARQNSGIDAALRSLGITTAELDATFAASADGCVALKDRAKRAHSETRDQGTRDAALAIYFLAAAIALTRHHTLISTRPKQELSDAFSDLAGESADPWRSIFDQAAVRAVA